MSYQKLIDSKATGAILFYGMACAPCQRLKPRLVELCKKLDVTLTQFNVATEMDAVRALGIRGVPTVVAIKDGRPSVLFTGDLHDERIASMLADKLL